MLIFNFIYFDLSIFIESFLKRLKFDFFLISNIILLLNRISLFLSTNNRLNGIFFISFIKIDYLIYQSSNFSKGTSTE